MLSLFSVPTLICSGLIAASGDVNVSWIVAYNGGRNVTAVQIEYTLAGTAQEYQPIDALVTPSATYLLVREQFVASRSYLFQISANNSVGSSDVVLCGPIFIIKGLYRYYDDL